MPVKNRFAELLPELTEFRRDLHRHPELMFDTVRTASVVADRLRAMGCDEVVTGVAQNGVVAVIKGKTDSRGRTVGLRADMDALPIEEATGAAYASTVPGKMHACGHDGHTTMLLGAAQYLSETRNFDGTVVLLFQPAEEGGGGADVMVKEGVLERFGVDEVYGMHNVPGREMGTFAIRSGPFYAAADQFEIVITGRAGHAAQPHQTIDATVVASHAVIALQTIAARETDPLHQIAVSVTSFETSTKAHNIIAERVKLRGTVRTFDAEVRDRTERRMGEILHGVAAAFGATAELDYQRGYPSLVNHEAETGFAMEAARKVAGDCDEARCYMWGEDFSYLLNERPGAYIHLGVGDTAPLHHPEYDFVDEVIPLGSSWFAEIVEQRLPAA
ncbi:MAG: amidohydrolase [Alphaproteobacteria bacterium]|nr:amidohydrolase [Alphaproteobacteria bacterium]